MQSVELAEISSVQFNGMQSNWWFYRDSDGKRKYFFISICSPVFVNSDTIVFGSVTKKNIQIPLPLLSSLQKWSSLHKRCAMCWNEWKNISQIHPIFSFELLASKKYKKMRKELNFLQKRLNSQERYRLMWQWLFSYIVFFLQLLLF